MYPIIDTVFVKIIRTLLESNSKERIETEKIFRFFEKILGLKISYKDYDGKKEYKFEDSKMVCYE
jgi:hypothetical protein